MIGEAAALAASLSWAIGSHLYGRIGRDGAVAPGAMNLGKCFTGAIFFAVAGLALTGRVVPPVAAVPAAWLAVSGVIGLALGDGAYFGAMAALGVRRALLLLSTAPVFTALGGAIWLGEPIHLRAGAGILAVLAGVALVVNEQGVSASASANTEVSLRGVLFGLGAGLGQAAGSLISRSAMASGDVSALDGAMIRLPAGLAGLVLVAGVSGHLRPWSRSLARPRLLAAIGVAAFIGTFGGIWLSQIAIKRAASTAIAATLLATSPIFALPLGRWLNAEPITPRAVGGTALACAGLVALTLGQS